jgi:hypothetical protein
MIISHKHKYLFVELPLTACTAIRKELRLNYDGEPILHKHATYLDFLKVANEEEANYFVFSNIRNPLDTAVSFYFKYKMDHKQRFSETGRKSNANFINKFIDKRSFNFIIKNDVDFPTYFRKFHKIPYNNWSYLSHKNFDYVIRFEHLQEDFAAVLKLLGLEQKKPLPQVNKTSSKSADFHSYYTPEIIPQAKQVFGPFMREWGYKFPAEWGDNSISWWTEFEFHFFNIFRGFYWKYIR